VKVRLKSAGEVFTPELKTAVFRVIPYRPNTVANSVVVGISEHANLVSHGPAMSKPSTLPSIDGQFEAYIRTENGNLYQTWPRLVASNNWQSYAERIGNFSMAFFGRAYLPWEFDQNKPVALVFFFRPTHVPVTFQIRRQSVMELTATQGMFRN
jgi:hypothetical protein